MSRRAGARALEAIRWVMLPKRPGVTGDLRRLVGKDSTGGAAMLEVVDEGFLFSQAGRQHVADVGEVISLIMQRAFVPERLVLIRDLRPRLFEAAVKQAERSTKAALAADRLIGERIGEGRAGEASTEDEDQVDINLILVWHHQDDAVWPALQAIVFAVAAAEAQVNGWAQERGGWSNKGELDEDRLGIVEKFQALATRENARLDFGKPPMQWLLGAVQDRDAIVHSRPTEEEFPLVGKKAPVAVRADVLAARRACIGVRSSLTQLAHVLSTDTPGYLACCPLNPLDDSAWASAWILTGIRDDPDFPPWTPAPDGGLEDQPERSGP